MYRYVGCENIFKDEGGSIYALEMMSPFAYETKEDAEKDNTSCCFEKSNGVIKLKVYSTKWLIAEENGKGVKVMRSIPSGKLVAEYTSQEFLSIPLNKIKKYNPPQSKADKEFEGVEVSFEDLYPGLEEGERITVHQSEVYYIAEDIECDS